MFFSTSSSQSTGRRSERGATLSGYALTMSVMVVVALGTISALETNSEDFLENTGDKIGEPRESAEVAVSNIQQSYGNGNSTGSGGAPIGTVAPNVSTTTTTAPPTTTTTAPPTTTTTVPPPVLSVANSFGGQSFDEYDEGAAAGNPNSGPMVLTAAGAGNYAIRLVGVTTGGGSDNSFFVQVNGGSLQTWHLSEGLSGQTVGATNSPANGTHRTRRG